MTRIVLTGLLALSATACGQALPASLPRLAPAVSIADKGALQGAYLSIDIRPQPQLLETAQKLRQDLHFLDMSHAVPPRPADVYHVTVAYFRTLSPRSVDVLAQAYRNDKVNLTVIGWGVAEQQAAYFAVKGLEGWQERIKGFRIEPFSADDPHITFGVSEGSRKDVHGVPKKAQHPLAPIVINGDVHLMQGSRPIW